MTKIVVLYYSKDGNTRRMANQIGRGIESISGSEAVIRTVPEVISTETAPAQATLSTSDHQSNAPYITKEEMKQLDGLIVGSPTRFGNMAAPLKFFFDTTSDLWLGGELCNKPAAVFTSTSTLHGGQESTLFTMMLPLIHHGMLIAGLPYTEAALSTTSSGGTPYGASHVSGTTGKDNVILTRDEKVLCAALGSRIATLAQKLAG